VERVRLQESMVAPSTGASRPYRSTSRERPSTFIRGRLSRLTPIGWFGLRRMDRAREASDSPRHLCARLACRCQQCPGRRRPTFSTRPRRKSVSHGSAEKSCTTTRSGASGSRRRGRAVSIESRPARSRQLGEMGGELDERVAGRRFHKFPKSRPSCAATSQGSASP